jgi:hypothetical protein
MPQPYSLKRDNSTVHAATTMPSGRHWAANRTEVV